MESFCPHFSKGYTSFGFLYISGTNKQVVSTTFIMPEYYPGRTPDDNIEYSYIGMYRRPESGVSSNTTIHWLKIEKGTKSHDDYVTATDNEHANLLINALPVNTANSLTDDNYYLANFTNSTTYRRKPFSTLWAWIKSKTDSLYSTLSHGHNTMYAEGDNRNDNTTPDDYYRQISFRGLKYNNKIGLSGATYSYLFGLRGWSDKSGGDSHEIAFNNGGIYVRRGGTEWGSWYKMMSTENITLDGTTLNIKL